MLLRQAFRIVCLLLLAFVLVSCERGPVVIPSSELADISVHAASLSSVPGWDQKGLGDSPGSFIWVAPNPTVTLAEIESVQKTKNESGQPEIVLRFTAKGAERMRKLSIAQRGNFVAIVLDGRVIVAPRVNTQITDGAVINGGGSGFTREEMDQMLVHLKRK